MHALGLPSFRLLYKYVIFAANKLFNGVITDPGLLNDADVDATLIHESYTICSTFWVLQIYLYASYIVGYRLFFNDDIS